MFHTSAPTVREWLDQAGIPVKPRTTRATRTQLDPQQVRELYEQRQWTSTEIAAHLDTTPALVLRTLHEHDVPVRRGPSRRPAAPDAARLTALYGDPEVLALLRAHRIPRRSIGGGIAERFPQPIPLRAGARRAPFPRHPGPVNDLVLAVVPAPTSQRGVLSSPRGDHWQDQPCCTGWNTQTTT
jgi:hypothetical protein